ncbi:hypothetical protein FACS1894216_13720 [Synergistales bacterium]|nr:hypothetical protein FACS1894216_13720 [Synergistales bacterium]
MNTVSLPPDEWRCGILISRVPKDGTAYSESFSLPLDAAISHWGQEYIPAEPIHADIEASYVNERILARVICRAEFTLPCSRCLAETRVAIFGDLRYLFTLSGDAPEDDDEADDGDVDVIPVDAFESEIEMTPYIWEALLLNLPERALCSENCKGLCHICGYDKNIGDCGCKEDNPDPRLAVLRDLME